MASEILRSPGNRRRIMSGLLLGGARRLRGLLREAPLWPAIFRSSGRMSAAFLPSKPRAQSSLLRIYAVAEALKARGWSIMVLPAGLDLGQRRRLLARFAPDVVVMQGARHPLNRPALYPGFRIAYDMDDADFELPQFAQAVREAMTQVDVVLAGSRHVADWCRAQGAEARVVWTGAPLSRGPRPPQAGRPPLVAWAQSEPVNYVLERGLVLDVMRRVAARRPGVGLRLFGRRPGDDEALLDPFREAGVVPEWLPMLPYERFLAALDDVAVGLSPICPENAFSRGKSFGKVLAYLDRGVPVVASDAADHSLFFTPETGILSNDSGVWAAEILRLLEDPAARQGMADAGHRALEARLSTGAAADAVDAVLRGLVETGRPGGTAPAP
jgi:glycosyltransferase involved in cell wall biosynthesis